MHHANGKGNNDKPQRERWKTAKGGSWGSLRELLGDLGVVLEDLGVLLGSPGEVLGGLVAILRRHQHRSENEVEL